MKKLLLKISIIVIIVILAYFKTLPSDSMTDITNNSSSEQQESLKIIQDESRDKLKELKKILDEKKEVEVFTAAKELFVKQISCITEKTCTQSVDNQFYDKKLDPANTILRRSLEILNRVSLEDDSKLSEITDDELLSVIGINHLSSSFLAYNLLIRKGADSFLKTKSMAFEFKGDDALSYLKQFRSESLLQDERLVEVRSEIINHYIANKDNDTIGIILDELNMHKLDKDILSNVLTVSCDKFKPFDTEVKKMIKVKLRKIAKSISQKNICQ